ncbi:MAG TPA: HEAT repeat domain-containing protein [Vicinamibacterales bacterium]|jgi:HEAT repeat protein|nr:HEAT repeat domain-containing protein [Vicinamibacterales bacterium]
MPDPTRVRPESRADSSAPPQLSADAAARLVEFARSCKAAARAVSLYPSAHPTIQATLARLAALTAQLTERGPYRLQVLHDRVLIDGAGMPRTDTAVAELAALLYRHVIGSLTLNAGADADSWRTLLQLLSRSPEDVRADGGIARLWATAGGPSVELQEIDYAEILREKQGLDCAIEDILAAAMAGPTVTIDDASLEKLREIIADRSKLDTLMAALERAAGAEGAETVAAAFLKMLRELTEFLARTNPADIPTMFNEVGHGVRKLSADSLLGLLAKRGRPEAVAAGVNVVSAVIDGVSDEAAAAFVSGAIIAERKASERLAHAFTALVPDVERRRQVLSMARDDVEASEVGQDSGFSELWDRVSGMLTSYSDANFVSDDYARELSAARMQPVDVEKTGDDPPERIATWLSTVNDSALRGLDRSLLTDLLAIESDSLRWRDLAETVVAHADDLVRVGYFDQAWELVEAVIVQSGNEPARAQHARVALERFGRGSMMKHVATHLRSSDDASYERFQRLCHAIGPSAVAPLAEVLSAEQDARSRRRLRDILIGFGAGGREAVQQLMSAPNWEVRRTAAYLLREFGGSEGLEEMVPLLTDPEPLVRREAVQGLVFTGSQRAAEILIRALTTAVGPARETLVTELSAIRDDRASSLFCHFVRHLDRRAFPQVYETAVDGLSGSKAEEAVEALVQALEQGHWLTPRLNRRIRAAAAQSLRRIGTPAALEALREASTRGPRGARSAARVELARAE